MKTRWLIIAGALVGFAVAFAAIYYNDNRTGNIIACGLRHDETISINSQKLQIQEATTAAARDQGLSGFACLEPNEGMLFSFSQSGYYAFWMKGMRFPLDIVWINSQNKVVTVARNVQPASYPATYVNKNNTARYVLELAANRSQTLNMVTGTPVVF